MTIRTIKQSQVLSEYQELFYKKAIGAINKEDFDSGKHRIQNEMRSEGIPFMDGQEAKAKGEKQAAIFLNGHTA